MSINQKDLKVGSHYLIESSENGILALRELAGSEYRTAIEASEWLHRYHYHRRREKEVWLNHDDFLERYTHYESRALTNGYEERHEFFVLVFVDLNRLLTNFLSSFRLFVDNFEIYLKKEYGEPSSEYQEFKKITNHEFLSNFAYRLFYRLRNYSQHKGFAIKSVGLDNEKDASTGEVKSEFKVNFDKEQFLKDDPSNFKHLQVDFNRFNKLFPVLPQMNNIKGSLLVIQKAIIDIVKSPLTVNTNVLLRYLDSREDGGELGFATFRNPSVGVGAFDSVEMPINILREVFKDVTSESPKF